MKITKKQAKALKRAAKRSFMHLNYRELETLLAVAYRNKIVLYGDMSRTHVKDPASTFDRLTIDFFDNFLQQLEQALRSNP